VVVGRIRGLMFSLNKKKFMTLTTYKIERSLHYLVI
jgi:hypothetical protein